MQVINAFWEKRNLGVDTNELEDIGSMKSLDEIEMII